MRNKKLQYIQKTGNSKVPTSLLLVTLNVYKLQFLKKWHRLTEWVIKQYPTVQCLQDSFWAYGHAQIESKKIEEDIICRQYPKESRGGCSKIEKQALNKKQLEEIDDSI